MNNTQEQKDFVRGLSETIANDICAQIDAGKIPANWDGHELRILLSYRHEQSAHMSRDCKRRVNKVIVENNL